MSDREEEITNSVSNLCDRNKWLIEYTEPLVSLLSECQDTKELSLVSDLLDHFAYLTEKERNEGYSGMASYIRKIYDKKHKLLIVAMSKGNDPDSGQKVLHELRTFLFEKGIDNYMRDNQFDGIKKIKIEM